MKTHHEKRRKNKFKGYAHHEFSDTFGAGAGPLRARVKLDRTFGRCQGWCDRTRDDEELYGGLCSLCRWYKNDNDIGG